MSELAFNVNGDSFEVPAAVVAWRVRRMKPRGAPELVYGRDGRPLTLPVEADIDELREAVGTVGKYRLDPISDDGKVAEGVPAAYVQVVQLQNDGVGMGAPIAAISVPSGSLGVSESDNLVRDAMRLNAEIAKSVIDKFPVMMDSAARLLEAADGAGLPRRAPRLLEVEISDQDEDDDDDAGDEARGPAPLGGLDINALIAQVVPVVVMSVMNGKFDLSKLGELLDWRKAAAAGKKAAASAQPSASPRAATSTGGASRTATRPTATADQTRGTAPLPTRPVRTSTTDEADDGDALPPLDPAAMAHFLAVQSALSAEEATLAREVAKDLSPRELRAWFAELSAMSVADAVAAIRAHVAPHDQTTTSIGGVS